MTRSTAPRRIALSAMLTCALACAFAACTKPPEEPAPTGPTSLKEVPAVRLNYRYEADVPAPRETKPAQTDERNAAVQQDFDRNRPNELLDKTLTSPDGKRVLAIYHTPTDVPAEFRLDMYSPDGQLLRKVTPDTMAVHFSDTIAWAPDSSSVAFVAVTRGMTAAASPSPTPTPEPPQEAAPGTDANTNSGGEPETDPEANASADLPPARATPLPPANVLTFRTEQIYTCNAEGDGVKPLTQNEGLIYFYYVWSPDSTMLAALAATGREWQYLELQANDRKEQFVPVGRPRVIEKNGRERRLDDGLTAVQPVWSPDSAKIACAFEHQARVYDSRGDVPTQAMIPLRNNLLLSSQAFDREQAAVLGSNSNVNPNANATANSNANTNPNAAALPPSALPDPNTLVSFNPIVMLVWPAEGELYFQTAFVKRMKNDADSVISFPRWHRIILTPQAIPANAAR
jgi:hypothetical protein